MDFLAWLSLLHLHSRGNRASVIPIFSCDLTVGSHFGQAAVKCSMKANEGQLYPLADSFLFLPKPPMHLPYSEISQVSFSRVSGGRTFDLTVLMRKGQEFGFSSLDKEAMPLLELFLAKRVRVKQEAEPTVSLHGVYIFFSFLMCGLSFM